LVNTRKLLKWVVMRIVFTMYRQRTETLNGLDKAKDPDKITATD